ncbi:MAG: peptide deformylase [Parcubacteria group bacterium]
MKNLIVDRTADILRAKANPLTLKEISSKKVVSILNKMRKALYSEDDGVAIAAPQIGESLRIFMVRGDILNIAKGEESPKESEKKDLIFINPEVVRASKRKKKMDEGCLSIRWLYGKVLRSEKVTIRAFDETSQKVEVGASGLLAQIFQHEIDHLEGILFIDKAEEVQDMPPTPHRDKAKSPKKAKTDE